MVYTVAETNVAWVFSGDAPYMHAYPGGQLNQSDRASDIGLRARHKFTYVLYHTHNLLIVEYTKQIL